MIGLLAKIQERLKLTALTREQFKTWDSLRQKRYLEQHPTSQFQKEGADMQRDPTGSRILHKVGSNGVRKYRFTDLSGKHHQYRNIMEVKDHHDALIEEANNHNNRTSRLNNPEHANHNADRINDHLDALERIIDNHKD